MNKQMEKEIILNPNKEKIERMINLKDRARKLGEDASYQPETLLEKLGIKKKDTTKARNLEKEYNILYQEYQEILHDLQLSGLSKEEIALSLVEMKILKRREEQKNKFDKLTPPEQNLFFEIKRIAGFHVEKKEVKQEKVENEIKEVYRDPSIFNRYFGTKKDNEKSAVEEKIIDNYIEKIK
ncbi:MAG TPA: hypothetical protein PK476_03075 [Candidatus Pacearchaeota archaeon]|nr:hypothetical protein [Candidatus Pacearchaeota archaeon]